ncbi:maltase 1-like [Anabrus simplex]|uniref:maltase 1-like n=1 Tax=Anabrus simplex TaxID=316456 RepID=UPI0035A3BBC2
MGIQSKLDYISSLGVKAICLSPIYTSPMVDFGYDIQDFKSIDQKFGTLDDFQNLLKEVKQRGLKLVMDFVPNHSSDQHEWFQKSILGEDPYKDYYVWAPPKAIVNGKPIPPNNWVSVFGGSAWEWNEERASFYLHQFSKHQPDLNFRNPAVVREMLEIIEFWLEIGVDGFRIESLAYLYEDISLRDEPHSSNPTAASDYAKLDHVYTYNLPEVRDTVAQFRHVLDKYANSTDQINRLMMAEVYDSVENTMKFYGDEKHPLADFPFNFLLITQLNNHSTAEDVMETVNMWLSNVPPNKWSNWGLGDLDNSRVATRFGAELVDGLNMLALLLPGTAITYAGEEIGMEDTPVTWDENLDPAGRNAGPKYYQYITRDPQRTPMQWNSEKNAGFSDANSTWLPINENYKTVNVEAQLNGPSHLSVYKALVKARKSPAIMYGSLDMKVLNNNTVLAFTR